MTKRAYKMVVNAYSILDKDKILTFEEALVIQETWERQYPYKVKALEKEKETYRKMMETAEIADEDLIRQLLKDKYLKKSALSKETGIKMGVFRHLITEMTKRKNTLFYKMDFDVACQLTRAAYLYQKGDINLSKYDKKNKYRVDANNFLKKQVKKEDIAFFEDLIERRLKEKNEDQ